jgi:dihydrofolate synthase/folylpolyglutamate synthase
MKRATAYLGDPQKAYRVIHVAGTNAKTSTARMIAALISAHGLRVGLMTSPPLTDGLERIVIDGEPIAPEAFIEVWGQVGPVVDLVDAQSADDGGPPISVFEAYALAGFVAFADAPVDVAVIEVGMGGTWDATNVVTSDVQVITPIAMDHEEWLGADLAGIAGEKAGILGKQAVIGPQSDAVAEVLAAAVAETRGGAWWAGVDFGVVARELGVGGQMVAFQGIGGMYPDVWLALLGSHQADNAALALGAVELLFGDPAAPTPLEIETVRDAFGTVTSPGRLEVVRTSPLVVIDAAHNPAGAEALAVAVTEVFPGPMVGLVGVLGDKDAAGILGALEPVMETVVVTQSLAPRALDAYALGAVAADVFGPGRVEVVPRLDDALARAVDLADAISEGASGPLAAGVLACGSVTVAGQVRLLLRPSRR